MSYARLLLIGTCLSCALAQPSFGADLPVKAPPPAPMVVATWTGFYWGVNVGYSSGRVETDRVSNTLTGGNAVTTDVSSVERSLNGVIGGGQIGWNWQVGNNWVWGFEADFQGSGQKNSSFSNDQAINAGVLQTTTTTAEEKLKWFGTIRGRGGFIVGNTLLYGTGGAAYGKVEAFSSVQRTPGVVGAAALSGSGSVSDTRWGWTAGVGAETRLWSGWTAKLEYLFVDLGKVTNSYQSFLTSGANAGAASANISSTHDFQDHIFRVGLNYSFGGR